MKITKRMLTGLGAIALAVSLLILVAPKAANAVVVTLVQVANTTANPAITQDVSKLASQNVQLWCVGGARCVQLVPDGETPGFVTFYTVPVGSSLVITTVQINTTGSVSAQLSQPNAGGLDRGLWILSAGGSFQFQYPSGIVFSTGSTLAFNGPGGSFTPFTAAYLTGYIVSN